MQWDLRETTLVAKDGKERERKKRIKEGRSIQRVHNRFSVFFFFFFIFFTDRNVSFVPFSVTKVQSVRLPAMYGPDTLVAFQLFMTHSHFFFSFLFFQYIYKTWNYTTTS